MSDDYQKGYDQALRDAQATIKLITDGLKAGKNYRALEIVLPMLAAVSRSVGTLEPGFFPANEPCPTSPTAN